MIASSRFRRTASFGLALALSLVAFPSCSGTHACNDIGCTSGLTIQLFGGTIDGGAPADTLDIEIEHQVDQIFAPLMTCAFTVNTHQLLCSSQWLHNEDTTGIHIGDTSLKVLRVTVSAAGNQISQDVYTLSWTSNEVWGPGCGYCTQSKITVNLPSS